MITRIVLLSCLCALVLSAQEINSSRIKGLRVNGSADARLPIAGLQSRPITIEFDVNETAPPDLRVRVYHCDRNWYVTPTSFVNDEMRNRTRSPIPYEPAPAGVEQYRFHYSIKLPGFPGVERFPQTGNYVFEICDKEEKEVLARGRFFVVEQTLVLTMKISNRSLPSATNPYNQVNKIEVGFAIPKADSSRGEVLYPLFFTCVDVYRNRQFYNPWRIDVNDQNPSTFADGFGTPKMKFVVDNVTPGNDYRRMDLRSIDEYPVGAQLRPRLGADVSRFLQKPSGDNHGTSTLTTGNRYADYVPFQFELVSESRPYDSVFVVADFNGWKPSAECSMAYNDETQRYLWTTWLRRGLYDYQYVVGTSDWIALEGNDWRARNVFTAFVYYRDSRFGGFDRIVGYIQRVSPSGSEATSD